MLTIWQWAELAAAFVLQGVIYVRSQDRYVMFCALCTAFVVADVLRPYIW